MAYRSIHAFVDTSSCDDATKMMLDEMLEHFYHIKHMDNNGNPENRLCEWAQCVQRASEHLKNILLWIAREDDDMAKQIRAESTALLEDLVPLWNAIPLPWKERK